jgi:glycosyltransferase involved in cell wall biosynthesis
MKKLRIHLTNVVGIGATQLVISLLPELERNQDTLVTHIYLPDTGALSCYTSTNSSTKCITYHRRLPRALSRLIECFVFLRGSTPLLILGDFPLRCNCKQTVFVHQSNLIKNKDFKFSFSYLKYLFLRFIFSLNIKYVDSFIVQSEFMQVELERSYPKIKGKVFIQSQPVPTWLLLSNRIRDYRKNNVRQFNSLTLFYPAAFYPHKNHILLSKISDEKYLPIKKIVLTIEPSRNPAKGSDWISCVGILNSSQMISHYISSDGLLFLSLEESFGFPLIEAMYVGLPIVCPNLPYARTVCGNQAIYFNPDDPCSLVTAINDLNNKLSNNWKPDWSSQLDKLPSNWSEVANSILQITCESD